MPRQHLNESLNLLFRIVKMRRTPNPPLPQRHLRPMLLPQLCHQLLLIKLRRHKRHRSGPSLSVSWTDHLISLPLHAFGHPITQLFYPPPDPINPHLHQHFHRRPQRQKPRHVRRPRFIPLRIGAKCKIVRPILLRIHHIIPPNLRRMCPLQQFPPNVKHPRPLRPEQPLVPIGAEIVDIHPHHVHRNNPQRLNRIQAKQNPPLPAEFPHPRHIEPLPGRKFHMRQRHQPRPQILRRGQDFLD